jgi:sucrose-6-phosphate hydrolase SacC (GH32 family)
MTEESADINAVDASASSSSITVSFFTSDTYYAFSGGRNPPLLKSKDLRNWTTKHITKLDGDAYELRITIDREEAEQKRFGFRLFADENRIGIPIYFQPNNGTFRVGETEAPFAVTDLPAGEDVELRIFIDKYLVEVFAGGRQAMVAANMDWQAASGFDAYTWGAPTTIKKVEIWKMKPTNQGYLDARASRIWKPSTE